MTRYLVIAWWKGERSVSVSCASRSEAQAWADSYSAQGWSVSVEPLYLRVAQ